jgi:hypothetical protein
MKYGPGMVLWTSIYESWMHYVPEEDTVSMSKAHSVRVSGSMEQLEISIHVAMRVFR